ncbi:MAG: hypothetical protein ACRDP8_08655 [Actinopolymorphaceae bacterium]
MTGPCPAWPPTAERSATYPSAPGGPQPTDGSPDRGLEPSPAEASEIIDPPDGRG